MPKSGLPALAALIPLAAHAAGVDILDERSIEGKTRYERCLQLTRQNAQAALNAATAWENGGGDGAASHCAALALTSLKRFPEAAGRLDRLGHENVGAASERAALFDQAGNAWLLANRGAEATASFSSALVLMPHDPDLLADRARAAAVLGDWKAAEADLTDALTQDSNRADLFVLRASARHALGNRAGARADLERALSIVPNYPEALVERGSLKFETGDPRGARTDWRTVVTRAPNSAAADAARTYLNSLPQPAKAK
jgi:tetratricopeptide (TPR) repeat protein